jgi:hypothetical protein
MSAQRPLTLDRLKKKKPARKEVLVVLDDDLTEAFEAADKKVKGLVAAGHKDDSTELVEAKAARDEAKAALDEATVTLVFQSIGRKAYEELVTGYPPSEEQKTLAKELGEEEPGFHAEEFPPALIAACCVEPKMTVEDAREIFDEWNTSETMTLFLAAIEVCNKSRVGELGKGFGLTTD